MSKIYRFLKFILIFLIIIVVILGMDIFLFGVFSKPKKSDCIIVLGCQVRGTTPSKFLRARLEKGAELLRSGYAGCIIVSGGKGPGEDITEAEAMKTYLLSIGVAESKIIMEDKSRSTMENLINSKSIMESRGFNTAIIVTNKYHLKRASIMAHKAGINASYSGVVVWKYILNEAYGFLREIPAIIRLVLIGR